MVKLVHYQSLLRMIVTFGSETTADEALKGVDLSNKVAVVTGATSGIGTETARALAAVGARVVITARDAMKAEAVLATLREAVPEGKFDFITMDLGSLKSVRNAAADLLRRFSRIHLLINNAGVMATPFGRTEDGFETQFGVDHLGHFVFTNIIVPALIAAAPARIVCLSSAAHLRTDILWDDVNFERAPYEKFLAYGQAKTANMLFAVALDRRLASRGVRAYGVHPGAINTGLGRHMTQADIEATMKWRNRREAETKTPSSGLQRKSISQGAASSVWAATSSELEHTGGVYIQDCRIAPQNAPGQMGVNAYALDPISAERLWSISEKMVGQKFDFRYS